MIASVSGIVAARSADWVVVETGGIGYRIETPSAVAASCHVGESVKLHTQLVVREDSHTLYGFGSTEALEMFNVLLQVNGVGPRSALGVLSLLEPQEIAAAVAAEDPKPFTRVSGIGPKSAKMILVSLAGKLDRFAVAHGGAEAPTASSAAADIPAQVVAALVGLGWQEKDAVAAVADAQAAGAGEDNAALLKAALVLLHNR